MKNLSCIFRYSLLLLMSSCAISLSAEKIVFLGGHEMLVREVKVVEGDQLELTLLEGGTIVLPKSAVERREHMSQKEALKAWKGSQKGSNVPSRSGALKDISWQKKMELLAAGPQPVDNGHSAATSLLYSKRGYTPPQPTSMLGVAPYGVFEPSEGALALHRARRSNLGQFPIQEATINRGAYKPQLGSRNSQMSPYVMEWKRNGHEPPPAGKLPGRNELRGK